MTNGRRVLGRFVRADEGCRVRYDGVGWGDEYVDVKCSEVIAAAAVVVLTMLIGESVATLLVLLSVGGGTACVEVVDTGVEAIELVVLGNAVVIVLLNGGMVCDCVVVKWGGIRGGTGATIDCGLPEAVPDPIF